MHDIHDSLGYLLNTAARLIKWECNNKLKEYDITTAQWAVMKDIYTQKQNKEKAECFMQLSIAQRLYSDRTTISQIIDKLEERKLLIRKKNPTDRRSHIVCITESGEALINRIETVAEKAISAATKDLPKDEYDLMVNGLKMIIHNLSENKSS